MAEKRSPTWVWDELVLVCDLMAFPQGGRVEWYRLLEEHPEVRELSEMLQELPLHSPEQRGSRFRTPGAVARKGENIRQWHESFGHAPNNGGRRDREVLAEFLRNPVEMHLQAEALRLEYRAGNLAGLPSLDADVDEGSAEGSVLRRLRLVRERDPVLRREKIDAVLKAEGRLACEVCTFDFASFYGERGKGFAEVHHAVPLHVTGPTKTRLTDLVVLCSNCHRMIHRGKEWMTPEELRRKIKG